MSFSHKISNRYIHKEWIDSTKWNTSFYYELAAQFTVYKKLSHTTTNNVFEQQQKR